MFSLTTLKSLIPKNQFKTSKANKLSSSKINNLKLFQNKQKFHRNNNKNNCHRKASMILKMTWVTLILFLSITLPLSSLAHSPPISSSSHHSSSLPIELSNAALRQRLLKGLSNKLYQLQKFKTNSNNNHHRQHDYDDHSNNYYDSMDSPQNNNNHNHRFGVDRLNKIRSLLAKLQPDSKLPSSSSSSTSSSLLPLWHFSSLNNHKNSNNPWKYFHYQNYDNDNKDSYSDRMPTCEELRFLWSIKQLVLLDDLANNNQPNEDKNTFKSNKFDKNDHLPESENDNDDLLQQSNNDEDDDQKILRKMLANVPIEKQVYITKIEPSDSNEEEEDFGERYDIEKSFKSIESTATTPSTQSPITPTTTSSSSMDIDSSNDDKNNIKSIKITEAETVSPYGIVHNSPSSERRGSLFQHHPSQTIGFFGEFIEDYFPLKSNHSDYINNDDNSIRKNSNFNQLRDHYYQNNNNGFNFHDRKISSPSKFMPSSSSSYGNDEHFVNGKQRNNRYKNRPKIDSKIYISSLPSSSSSSSLSSSSKSSSSSRMMLPGFWHDKPVKPSVNLIN